jgi:hypothetical protein
VFLVNKRPSAAEKSGNQGSKYKSVLNFAFLNFTTGSQINQNVVSYSGGDSFDSRSERWFS